VLKEQTHHTGSFGEGFPFHTLGVGKQVLAQPSIYIAGV
jgi:hypothetical protein